MRTRRHTPRLESLEARELQTVWSGRRPGPAVSVLDMAQRFASQPVAAAPPLVPGPGDPLPIELARTRFHAAFLGPFRVGPPHYTGQTAIFGYRGLGASTQFLHGSYQMIVILPKDPNADITGAAFLQDKNAAGGTQVGLDLLFDKTSLDRRGRPTRGTWSPDSNIYGGLDFVAQGTGAVKISYAKNGNAAVFFDGRLFTNGITNPTRNADLRVKLGRR